MPVFDLVDVPNDQLTPEQQQEKKKQLFMKVLCCIALTWVTSPGGHGGARQSKEGARRGEGAAGSH